MNFVVPGKGVYGGVILSDLQGEPIDITALVDTFSFEQRPPDEDGTPNDTIVLGARSLVRESWYLGFMDGHKFLTAFEGDLPSVRNLTFLPLRDERGTGDGDRANSGYRHLPGSFLPTEPHIVDVGILERTTERRDGSGGEYTVVLQVL